MTPFIVLGIGIAFIVIAIVALKLHPFLALILAAILVGLLSPQPLLESKELSSEIAAARAGLQARLESGEISSEEFEARSEEVAWELQNENQGMKGSQGLLSLKLAAEGFGQTAAGIAIVIALAAVIGQCLLESGAADKITRKFLGILGERMASVSLMGSGYLLSIPVFFDTVFYLLVPLARSFRLRTGRNYLLYIMAICAGGAITHSLVPPTPGPLVMVETLPGLELGAAIGVGFLLGLLPALIGGLGWALIANRVFSIPMREVPGMSQEELEEISKRPDEKLPGFFLSILPILLPVVLITGQSVISTVLKNPVGPWGPWPEGLTSTLQVIFPYTAFFGEKNFALLLATFVASWVLKRQSGLSLLQLKEKLEPAFFTAGVIILITSAGGAFGKMLTRIGLAEALSDVTSSGGEAISPLWLLVLAWGIAVVMKVAQGSGTVSMITSAGIMASLLSDGTELPFHMVYVFAAIGFGSLLLSWMNDSGFWIVCKLSGFTERETLATWSVLLGVMSIVGLAEVLVLSHYWPLVN